MTPCMTIQFIKFVYEIIYMVLQVLSQFQTVLTLEISGLQCHVGCFRKLKSIIIKINKNYYYSFSKPNVSLARLQMELYWAAMLKSNVSILRFH